MVKLSIIIPVYNAEKYIGECLKSIVGEINNSNIEVIIINDGSNDCTSEMCEQYCSNYVILYNNSNHGVSYSRNYGISKAKGEYIMFVDADDMMALGWKDTIIGALTGDSDIYYFFKDKFKGTDNLKNDIINYTVGLYPNSYNLASVWSKVYKRQLLLNNEIEFNEKIINGEDLLFNIECVQCADRIKICNESVYQYRITRNSSTMKFNDGIFQSDKEFHRCLDKLLRKQNNLSEKNCRDLLDFSKKNNIYVAALRVSYIGKYKEFKKRSHFLDELCTNDTKNIKLGLMYEMIIKLLRGKKYFMVFTIFNIKNTMRCLQNEKVILI